MFRSPDQLLYELFWNIVTKLKSNQVKCAFGILYNLSFLLTVNTVAHRYLVNNSKVKKRRVPVKEFIYVPNILIQKVYENIFFSSRIPKQSTESP